MRQQQLLQIQTASIHDRNGIYYIAEGYLKCSQCQLYIKCDGNRCPFCKQKMSRRFGKASTRERLAQYLKNPIRPEPPKRSCSSCGSDKTVLYMRYKSPKPYTLWYKDGKGGNLCNRCYGRQKRASLKATH